MSKLHALFDDPAAVRAALDRLEAEGVAAAAIEIRSSIPLEHDLVPAGLRLRSRAAPLAVLGGLAGGAGAIAFTFFAANAYPLAAGGIPIVAGPPTMIIAFEGIALGAMLTTVATVLLECGMPRLGWKSGPFDEQLAAGKIVVSVDGGTETSPQWASAALATDADSDPAGS